MKLSFRCFSQRGVGKAHNEDAVLVNGRVHQGSVREHGEADLSWPCYFAVADGVSTGTQPRTASRRLLELLRERLEAAEDSTSVVSVLHQVQHDYAELGIEPQLRGMASTLVVIRVAGDQVTICNVGDSRAYVLADGQAKLRSRDHSLLNDLIDDGEVSQDQAADAGSFMRGLTCQFVVDREFDQFRVNTTTHRWRQGERLLLGSDGLNEVLDVKEIAALCAGQSDEDLANACKASRRAGGMDDFSAILLTRMDEDNLRQ